MATTNRPRTRQKAPSNAEWDRIKPVFERLYIGENLKLPRISAILACDHDFHAAPYMYKLRISQWGLRKNFKLEELQVVASSASHFVQAGLSCPMAIIDSREVPIERAKRHFRELFLADTRNQPSSATPISALLRQRPRIRKNRHKMKRLDPQRRSSAISRIFLQQSAESHLLESTLAAVNNYYGWRLTRDDDYFINVTDDAGDHIEAVTPLDPSVVANTLINSLNALVDGVYQIARVSLQQFCRQARILLFQQHPSLLEHLIGLQGGGYSGIAHQLHQSAFSYLSAVARRILPQSHPILMVLQLLDSHEETRASLRLLLQMMCEVAERQCDMDAQAVYDLEERTVLTSVYADEFDVSLKLCESLLQRYVIKFREGHRFCRRALYLLGYLKYRYDLNDEAEEIMLRTLKLDDGYERNPENADWISINAMEVLAWICEERGVTSEVEKWLSRAHAAMCEWDRSDDGRTQNLQHQLDQIRRRLDQEEDISESSEEDGVGILEELEMQLAQVALEETTEVESHSARVEPWNIWEKDIQHPNIRDSVPQTRKRRNSFMSGSISTADDGDEDGTDIGSESYAASEQLVPPDIGPGQPPLEGGPEKSSWTHDYTQDSGHVEDEGGVMWEESQLPKFDFNDGAAVAPMAMVEDPLTFLSQQKLADFQEHMEPVDAMNLDFSDFDFDSMGLDMTSGDIPMDFYVSNDLVNVDTHPQEQTALLNTTSFPAMELFFPAGKQDTRSPPVMESFQFDKFDDTEMFDGTNSVPTLNVDMYAGVDTIDPKLIFCSSSGHGYVF